MKKVILSISLLCSVPVYAMQQEFLTLKLVKALKASFKDDEDSIEEVREKRSDINCMQRAVQLLEQYHANSGVVDPQVQLEAVRKNAAEECENRSDVEAMYEGLIWAGKIKNSVMANDTIKQLEKKVEEDSEDDFFIGIEFFAKCVEYCAQELEKDEKEKPFYNFFVTLEGSSEKEAAREAFKRYLLVPVAYTQEREQVVNARIKKLFANNTAFLLCTRNVINKDTQASEDDTNSSDDVTYESSDEE